MVLIKGVSCLLIRHDVDVVIESDESVLFACSNKCERICPVVDTGSFYFQMTGDWIVNAGIVST